MDWHLYIWDSWNMEACAMDHLFLSYLIFQVFVFLTHWPSRSVVLLSGDQMNSQWRREFPHQDSVPSGIFLELVVGNRDIPREDSGSHQNTASINSVLRTFCYTGLKIYFPFYLSQMTFSHIIQCQFPDILCELMPKVKWKGALR